jgi:hypothetical protein
LHPDFIKAIEDNNELKKSSEQLQVLDTRISLKKAIVL